MRIASAALLAALTGAGIGAAAPAAAQGRSDERGEPQRQEIVTHVRTVSELAAVCDPRWGGLPRLEAIAYCQGYLTAAVQYHTLTRPPGGRVRQLFCVPGRGPSVAESGIGFAQWARENPRHANEPALDGFLRWAQERFPCRPSPPRGNR
jgi:hypothetical protein